MKRLWILMFVFLAACSTATVNYPDGHGGTGTDDSNTANSLSDVNPASPGNNYATQLYNFLTKEDANRYSEQGFQNYVSNEANANACLGGTGAGLIMTPTSCIAYNAGFRGTETGSITFADNSTTWVAMDENTTGSNANLPNFTRVAGTHYLIDSSDASPPTMASDSQILMKVVTSGGAITSVTDLRNLTPLASGQNQGTNGLFNTITGTGTAPVIAGLNGQRQNEINLMAYGASGLGVDVTTATGTATQNTITVASASGWSKNQGIIVHHAGAAVTLSTPGAPTVTPKGTTGASTCTYAIRALTAKRGYTAAGVTGSTASCNAVQSGTNYNLITWSPVANAWGYAVERTTGTPALIAVTTDTRAIDLGQSAPFGTYQTFGELPTTANGTTGADWLQTTISSINGTIFTLGASLTTSITAQQISHDDSTPITNAYTAAVASNKVLYVPQGSYFFCGTPLSGGNINIEGAGGTSSAVITCDGQYLLQPSVRLTSPSKMRNISLVGGLGAFHQTYTGGQTTPNGEFVVQDVLFWDYTALAWGSESTDYPFIKIDHSFFRGLDHNKTMGVFVAGSTGSQITNSVFDTNHVGLKESGGGAGIVAENNTFISLEPLENPQNPRIGIWVGTGAGAQASSGNIIAKNKFGNEGPKSVDDFNILVADEGSGTDHSNEMPAIKSADDLTMTAGGATLTSAAECPFASTDCQGGVGSTGVNGNSVITVERAGRTTGAASDTLTTTITTFTNTCTVVLAAVATNTVSSAVGHWAIASANGISGAAIISNFFIGVGNDGSVPLLYSTGGVSQTSISHNDIEGGAPTNLLEVAPLNPLVSGNAMNNVIANRSSVCGALPTQVSPGQCAPSNQPNYTRVTDPYGNFSVQGPYSPAITGGTRDAGYNLLLSGLAGAGYANGAAFVGNVTDSNGDANAGTEASFTNGGTITANFSGTVQVGVPIWVEFELKSGAPAISRVTMEIFNAGLTSQYLIRPVIVGAGWKPYRFWFVPADTNPHDFVIQNFWGDGNDTGHILIGRVRIYQAWEPVIAANEHIHGGLTLDASLIPGISTFANLGTPAVPVVLYCSDCKNSVDDAVSVGATCVSGGHGALAVRQSSLTPIWSCK